MDKNQIEETLTPLVRKAFNDDSLVVSGDLCPNNVPGWTSLSFMQLLESVESVFEIKFRLTELLSVRSLGDLVSAIERHFQ